LTALRKGDLHLTAVSLLAPQLTAENVTELLAAARHRTADEIRRMLADRQPKPDVASSVRRLSVSSARAVNWVDQGTTEAEIQKVALENERGLPLSAPAQPTRPSGAAAHSSQPTRPSGAAAHSSRPPEPLGDERYLIRFTADREFHAQIQELKSMMRHQIPDGDVGKILAKAVAVLLKQARARKFGACTAPRAARCERVVRTESAERVGQAESAGQAERVEQAERVGPAATPSPSRQIPAGIRRAVSKRDGERCTFVSASGRRCGSRDFLEFHHRDPWARHRSHAIDGITLRCRAHNQYEAERDFGVKHMQRFRGRGQPQIAAPLPETTASLPVTAGLLTKTQPHSR
jgi:hypothetical protein